MSHRKTNNDDILRKIFSYLLSVISDGITSLLSGFNMPKNYDAKLGKETDIANRFNHGFVISKHRRLSRKKGYEGLLIAGPIGGGKTSKLLIKSLLKLRNCIIIVNDPSKELYQLTSGHLSQWYEIKTINFADSSESYGYNILSSIKKESDINRIAHALISATLDSGGKSDPFWSLQSRSLLVMFIKLVSHYPEFKNMANVRHLLKLFAASPKEVDMLIVKTGDQQLILDYKALLKIPEKTLQSIVISAMAATELFADPEIAKVTSYNSIDLATIRQGKPCVIYLHNDISMMRYVNTLIGIVIDQIYAEFLGALPDKNDLDVAVIIEEAGSGGIYSPNLANALSNCRKHRVSTIICTQSPLEQLSAIYGVADANTILNNLVTKVYLPGLNDLKLLQQLETLSGKGLVKDKKGNEKIQPLLTMDVIRRLPENRSIIVSGNNPVIIGHTSPYFRSAKYRKYTSIQPVPFTSDIPKGPIPLIGQNNINDHESKDQK